MLLILRIKFRVKIEQRLRHTGVVWLYIRCRLFWSRWNRFDFSIIHWGKLKILHKYLHLAMRLITWYVDLNFFLATLSFDVGTAVSVTPIISERNHKHIKCKTKKIFVFALTQWQSIKFICVDLQIDIWFLFHQLKALNGSSNDKKRMKFHYVNNTILI